MRTYSSPYFLALLLGARAAMAADADAGADPGAAAKGEPLPQVTVTAGRLAERRADTTSRIIVGQADIVRDGDRSLSDVLKRLPGISVDGAPGQGGAIRMRGLGNGYTQILLNGVPAPAGFSLDAMAPELIERIEIQRAPTAETGGQAIAGSINLILKKAVAASQRELKWSVEENQGALSPQLVAQLADRAGALSYTLTATALRKRTATPMLELEERRDAAGLPLGARETFRQQRGEERVLNLAPRLNWTLANGDALSAQLYASLKLIDNASRSHEHTLLGEASEFPDNQAAFQARGALLRGDLGWVRKLDGGARLELKLGASDFRRKAGFRFYGLDGEGRRDAENRVDSGAVERNTTLAGSYRRPMGADHALALGWDGGDKRRDEYRDEARFGAGGAALAATAERYSVGVRQLALFVQDEWDVTPRWSLYLGLRRESLNTASRGGVPEPVDVRSAVWSPLLHSLYKLPGNDQLRLALSRSYKAPAILDLLPRRFLRDNNNNPTNPDTQGNPALRPELAWGLDAAFEHYFAGDGMLSAGLFLRRIQDVRQERLYQREGRWVATPVNDGAANVRGIELEAKLPLTALWSGAPALALRANLTRNWSHVQSVPGPDNRLDAQVPLSANIGLDYKPAGAALSFGGNLNFQGGGAARESATLLGYTGAKRELDLYGLWTMDGKTRLRLSAANLLRQDYQTRSDYADGRGALDSGQTGATYRSVRLAFEHQF